MTFGAKRTQILYIVHIKLFNTRNELQNSIQIAIWISFYNFGIGLCILSAMSPTSYAQKIAKRKQFFLILHLDIYMYQRFNDQYQNNIRR